MKKVKKIIIIALIIIVVMAVAVFAIKRKQETSSSHIYNDQSRTVWSGAFQLAWNELKEQFNRKNWIRRW